MEKLRLLKIVLLHFVHWCSQVCCSSMRYRQTCHHRTRHCKNIYIFSDDAGVVMKCPTFVSVLTEMLPTVHIFVIMYKLYRRNVFIEIYSKMAIDI